jgi:hypothetical protein
MLALQETAAADLISVDGECCLPGLLDTASQKSKSTQRPPITHFRLLLARPV